MSVSWIRVLPLLSVKISNFERQVGGPISGWLAQRVRLRDLPKTNSIGRPNIATTEVAPGE